MKQRILTVRFTIASTIVFVAPISFVYLLTKGRVALNEEVFLKRAVLAAAGIPVPSANGEVVSLFSALAEEVKAGDAVPLYYRTKSEAGGEPAGYVFIRSGPGLWGEITATVGFDSVLSTLTGVDFLKQSETPGLGARISETWFKEQFRGKKGPFTTVGEGEPASGSQFDAITGASITSNAVMSILNSTISQVKGLVK